MATTARPPSLGDKGAVGYTRVREEAPLPAKRDLIITEIDRILGLGLVQKLVVEVGQPIHFERLVKSDGIDPDLTVVETGDLFAAMRNSDIVDFVQEFQVTDNYGMLFQAFRQLEEAGAAPKALLLNQYGLFRQWLRLPATFNLSVVFGVKTYLHEDIPDDVLVLVGCDKNDQEQVTTSIRIPMDIPVHVAVDRPGKKKP